MSVFAYFKACLDDSDRKHKDPRNCTGPSPKKHSLYGPWAAVPEEVQLKGVVGAEVDPHSRDCPHKRLEERGWVAETSQRKFVYKYIDLWRRGVDRIRLANRWNSFPQSQQLLCPHHTQEHSHHPHSAWTETGAFIWAGRILTSANVFSTTEMGRLKAESR